MQQISNILIWLFQKLYPQGRAFLMPPPVENITYITDEDGNYITDEAGNFLITEDSTITGGIFYRLHRALSVSFGTAYTAACGVQDAQLPDNANFTISDAHDWYRRLGIYDSGGVSLSDMKLAIRQRMSFPLVPLNKQSLAFIQAQLQAAGFNVFLYKNKFSDGMGGFETQTPAEVLGLPVGNAIYGAFEYGDANYGGAYADYGVSLLVNYIEDAKDALFAIGDNYRATFYVAGPDIATFANVPESRHIEFRQLLLKYKAAQMCAFLFVNYT